MKLGIMAGYSPATMSLPMENILEAERLGYDSVWTAEAYGSDAVTPATWILANTTRIDVGTAIMQMPARTPACAAMTAMTLHQLSGGRFRMGFGPSGPQVVEGWHGVPYGRPLTRIREYVSIIRQILAREAPVTHDGFHYQLPYNGEGATGLGKPLKSILHGDPSMKIYSAAITPGGVRTAAEIADGFFPLWMNPQKFSVFEDSINTGFEKAGGGKSLEDFDVAPFVTVLLDDDIEKAREKIRRDMSLYIGGMGAKDKNFYNDYCKRLGYEDAATEIQDHFLAGRRDEAAAAVPNDLIDDVALVGPADRIREHLGAWRQAGSSGQVGSMLLKDASIEALRLMAEELL